MLLILSVLVGASVTCAGLWALWLSALPSNWVVTVWVLVLGFVVGFGVYHWLDVPLTFAVAWATIGTLEWMQSGARDLFPSNLLQTEGGLRITVLIMLPVAVGAAAGSAPRLRLRGRARPPRAHAPRSR